MNAFALTMLILHAIGALGWLIIAVFIPGPRIVTVTKATAFGRGLFYGGVALWAAFLLFR